MRMDTIGAGIEQIPVSINYDIIHLFSEGLYKSPHKAIEELVSNSTKNVPSAQGKRAPIGQFGIGKLASYVLAWD